MCACLASGARAEGLLEDAPRTALTRSRLAFADPLNGSSLLVNMHGMLFHPALEDIQEDVAYARWLGSGVIRVFATDNNGLRDWDGKRVGNRIAEVAPMLRAADARLIVALVNNHRAVPGELAASAGWLDNYWQLLLPFYTSSWRGAYLKFMQDVVTTVQARGAQDVVFAWELGNELHTPGDPKVLMRFVTEAAAELRALDPSTPILPGTMGANHVQPGDQRSAIARWLYCDAPIDAYTLHAYDFVSRQRPGDMPIDWDLDNIVAQPCPDGRTLPVIVEELGTSRELPGVYGAADEAGRVRQEIRQIEFIRQYPQVVGFGVWNGESPRLADRTFFDTRRGLTSYGPQARGGGSCYDPSPEPAPGARCQLEQVLRGLRFVRVDAAARWTPGADADPLYPLLGSVDPVAVDPTDDVIALTGWVTDPAGEGASPVDTLDLFLGQTPSPETWLARGRLGLPRIDTPSSEAQLGPSDAGFALNLPLGRVPVGSNALTLTARSSHRGTWQTTLQVVVPRLGAVAPVAPKPVVVLAPPPPVAPVQRAEIQSPQAGDRVARRFAVQVFAPGVDRIDVFLEPGRDLGGRLVGSAVRGTLAARALEALVSAPPGAQVLYVHAHHVAGGEDVLPLRVVVS